MGNSQKNIITEIAENLDCGSDCYYNPTTDEIVTIPNLSHMPEEKDRQPKSDLYKIRGVGKF